MTRRKIKRLAGFTLIEMAVALVIVVLILGSIMVPVTTQVAQRKVTETQRSLDETREALIGFALANGYLPCPAISATNGLEDRNAGTGACNARVGYIPWMTLNVSKLDTWGNILRYSVSPLYARSPPGATFGLTTAPDITIRTRDALGNLVNLSAGGGIPAVVLSHGRNGYGGFTDAGIAHALPATWPANNTDEDTNASGPGTTFVSRTPQDEGAAGAGGEFDDILSWLSPNVLFNRMVTAGKLP